MNIQRLQGLALILSAVCTVLVPLTDPQTALFDVIALIGVILFMLGIPAIYSAQPTGWVGLAGIVLLELAALISLGFRFEVLPSNLESSLSLTSAILGTLGGVLIGWLMLRGHVFPAWVGWLFLLQALLNLFAGLFDFGSLAGLLRILLPGLMAAALLAAGAFLYQKRER